MAGRSRCGPPRTAGAPPTRLRVVGTYAPYDASSTYWFDHDDAGVVPAGSSDQVAGDAVLAAQGTVADGSSWGSVPAAVDVPLDPDRVRLGDEDRLRAGLDRLTVAAAERGATVTSELTALLDSAAHRRGQAAVVVPVLAVQLGLLCLVALAAAGAAAVEQRRPLLALARLRGQGAGAAARLIAAALGPAVLLGSVLGGVLGQLVTGLAVSRWLPGGVGVEWRWPVAAAVAGAAGVAAATVAVAAAPALREPVADQLRRVPARRSAARAGLVDGAAIAFAVAALVTAWSAPSDTGPVALAAPALLALAIGLLVAQVLRPVSGRLGSRALRRGRLAAGLAATWLSRGVAMRRVLVTVTVAITMLVLAADAWSVAERARSQLAGLQAGAPVVLTGSAAGPGALRRAVAAVEPTGRYATPVAVATSATADGPTTTAVIPTQFLRVARWGDPGRAPDPGPLAALSAASTSPVRLSGGELRRRASSSRSLVPLPPDLPPTPPPRPERLVVQVVDPDSAVHEVDLGRLVRPEHVYRAAVPCAGGCRLHRIGIRRVPGDISWVSIELRVDDLRVDGAPVPLHPSDGGWAGVGGDVPATIDGGPRLRLTWELDGTAEAQAQRSDVPVELAALRAGPVSAASATGTDVPVAGIAEAPDLTGATVTYGIVGQLVQVPRSGAPGLLVDLGFAGQLAGPIGAGTRLQVWLAADDPGREAALVAALERRQVVVTARDTEEAHEEALAAEAPTPALRLALVVGVAGVLIAAVGLLVAATTARSARARDLAALRVCGVPPATLRAAATAEPVAVVLLGTALGAGLGLLGAHAVLDRILLTPDAGVLPTAVAPAWAVVAIVVGAAAVVLCATAVAVGRAASRSADPRLLRTDPQ